MEGEAWGVSGEGWGVEGEGWGVEAARGGGVTRAKRGLAWIPKRHQVTKEVTGTTSSPMSLTRESGSVRHLQRSEKDAQEGDRSPCGGGGGG